MPPRPPCFAVPGRGSNLSINQEQAKNNRSSTSDANLTAIFFIEKHNTSRHYMWRFIACLSAVRNPSEQKRKSKLCCPCFTKMPKCDENKNSL